MFTFKTSPVFDANWNATEDIIVNPGGTYSGKTFGIMQVLYCIAVSQKNKTITVVSESVPNLKKGVIRDLETFLRENEPLMGNIVGGNKTDRVIKTHTNCTIEFTSYVTAQDAHSGKRDYLFINEAPGISWDIAEQLINRTNIRTFIDFNPSIPFWAHEKLINPGVFGTKKVKVIISDHRHNPFLSQAQHDHIEARAKEDPEWGRVYARGMLGKIEGLIFRNWELCDEIPQDAKFIGWGMDFGFTNDPTAVLGVWQQEGKLWVDLKVYETRLTNPDIHGLVKGFKGEFIGDSAEPKSIEELRRMGLNIVGATKGPDSVRSSIDILKRYKLMITRSSQALIKELNAYKWKTDRATGITGREPVDFMNHAIDAMRYVALNKLSTNMRGVYSVV